MRILTVADKKDEKFLRQKTKPVDLSALTKTELRALINDMRTAMRKAEGIGLSANQIGLSSRFFVAEVLDSKKGSNKFYAVFNPEIVKQGGELVELEEGCLSVPGKYGRVPRYERVTLSGTDQNGRALKIKAWGLLAHVFQHEVDHLNGILFLDKAKSVEEISREEWRERKAKRRAEETK